MNRVEQILKEHKTQSKLANFIKSVDVLSVAEQTALEFTKWKDENYYMEGINEYTSCVGLIDVATFKTIEQLFNEWNNLNNK